MTALLVILGAAIGAPARFVGTHHLTQRAGLSTNGATLVINVLGSFVLGLVVGADPGTGWLTLVGVGFCGAFTTFSTLALELWTALAERRIGAFAATIGLSLVLGVGAAFAGVALTG